MPYDNEFLNFHTPSGFCMTNNLFPYRITTLPSELNPTTFVEALLDSNCLIIHDLKESSTSIVTDSTDYALRLHNLIPGFDCEPINTPTLRPKQICLVPFLHAESKPFLEQIYRLFRGLDARLLISFVRCLAKYPGTVKERIEESLSQKEVRLTRALGNRFSSAGSTQHDLYYGSDERQVLTQMLEEINKIMSANGSSYKILFILEGDISSLSEYIYANSLILSSAELSCSSIDSLYSKISCMDSMPFHPNSSAGFLGFSDRIRRKVRVNTDFGTSINGEINVGNFLEGSIGISPNRTSLEKSTLNLGTIITGLPGTGKTLTAMHLASQIYLSGKSQTSVVVISPTKEWSEFGNATGINVIRLYDMALPINFFKCYNPENREPFYQNLAMLLAYASKAGPYRNSLEKCLLSAFNKAYREDSCPDPVLVYNQIEEAIIEQHGRRTSTGVRYTKHGENIRAALENLRLMLFRPEFAVTDGIDLEELFAKSVIFDLSNVSNNMKQFFYSLILNQLYNFLGKFDEKGDSELRASVILEEAQLAIEEDEKSAVTIDLIQRIQDFRKKGIGLVIITHNLTDMHQNIRRLCQTKLYFRQSSDVAKYAAIDLGFNDDTMDNAIGRLRGLEHRVCAVSCIETHGNEKLPIGPFFTRTEIFKEFGKNKVIQKIPTFQLTCNCIIEIPAKDYPELHGRIAKLLYLNEVISECIIDKSEVRFKNLIMGKDYLLLIEGGRKKDAKTFGFVASEKVHILRNV
ncbi:MAG: ATP-binding protein [Candidatus Micrarchaeota archaeon]|nr:ATP-binding protein [Candidatus Micrarchaeota archaeon]MDE1847584.1 ATP-binding protein [Candidatus Micrarchaeota archaeon]MDE1864816.1 ATP-binding protein [Candidatus Micrarchaeota archaeon]